MFNCRRAIVLSAVLWLAAGQLRSIQAATTTLHLRVTVDARLSEDANRALVREVSAIWRRSGVLLVWEPGMVGASADRRYLRVLVLDRSGDISSSPDAPVVGELFRLTGGEAVAIASIDRARRIVAETTSAGPTRPVQWSDRILGVVLGRALAHEIGHFLLDTSMHEARGLMRAAFTAQEFVDLRQGGFTLDREATSRLGRHADRVLSLKPRESGRCVDEDSCDYPARRLDSCNTSLTGERRCGPR